MSNLRRYYSEGNIYFVTSVTIDRKPLLAHSAWLLQKALTSHCHDKGLIAWVILPEHFHAIIDPSDENLSNIVRQVKLSFSVRYKKLNKIPNGRIWQYRFWDHVIRGQEDLNYHIDYIHYNPVKHRYVNDPNEWIFSSFHNYRKLGYYSDGWGVKEIKIFEGDFGE